MKDLLREARFLLLVHGPEECPEWEEGVGDCEKSTCSFCRVQKCIDKLGDFCNSTGADEEMRQ